LLCRQHLRITGRRTASRILWSTRGDAHVTTFYFVIASLRTDLVLVAILALIFIGLVLLAIGAGTSTTGFTRAGGWVTLAFAVIAWYHAAGDVISATLGRPVLPVRSLRR
jgi:hypothetical protein